MKAKFIISLLLLFFSLLLSVSAQDSSYSHQSFRLEVGLGLGFVGKGGGLSGRLGLSVLSSTWGGALRITAHDGEQGKNGWFGPPIEKYFDTAVLLSYILYQNDYIQVVGSSGVGFVHGERLTASRLELEDFDGVTGFAYEFGIASVKSTFGYSVAMVGNINSVSNITAFICSVTLGVQK